MSKQTADTIRHSKPGFLDYEAVTLTAILRRSACFNFESTKHNLPFHAFFTEFRKYNGKVVSVSILQLPKFSMDFDKTWYCGRTFSNLAHHQTAKASQKRSVAQQTGSPV